MTRAQQNAVLQEALDQSNQFRQNQSLRYGLVPPPRNVIGEEQQPPPQPAATVNIEDYRNSVIDRLIDKVGQTVTNTTTLPAPSALTDVAKKALLYAGLAAGGAGAGGLIGAMMAQPNAPAPVVVESEATGDLIQYLHENGYDRPPSVEP